ncbi:MAG: flagellar basal body rod modification protein [Candidatus Cloacimonetes bacterium ADurb.Bin089]|nr:MAG: flagellar basal body rod modification protein [Candidatus Cloacimonetes bacterium ADurb.Bin089]
MPGLIAVFWDDLHCDQGSGDIYFQSFGEEPNRYCVIQWHNVRFHAGTGVSTLLDFEVILHENGEIVMQYNSTATGQTGANVPHDNGKSATVALQSADATMGICYLREIVQNNVYLGVEPAGNLLFDGLAISFYSGEDTQAPFITHTAPGNTFNPSPVLTARVLDLSELANVTLHYNFGEGWNTLEGVATGDGNYDFTLTQIPAGHPLSYYFAAADIHNNSSALPAAAPTEFFQFKILPSENTTVLLAYSGKQDYQNTELPVYIERLNNANITYDIYNWEEYAEYTIPDVYSTILAYANTGTASPATLYLSQKLMDFLNSGTIDNPKNLFFSSDGFAFSQAGTPNSHPMKQLLNGYFRTYSVSTGSGGGTNGLAGPDVYSYQTGTIMCTNSSPVGTINTEYSVYANSPDCIFAYDSVPDWYADLVSYPEIGAVNAFIFEDGPVDGHAYLYHGVCATAVETPAYRTFYFSFDFSQLNNSTQSSAFFSDLINWFGITPHAVNDNELPLVQSKLMPNYPNPFNPKTTIAFTLAKAGKVDISIYNLKGQKVKTLLSENLLPGKHSIVWDGKDEKGSGLGSGIYFVKMQTGKTTDTRKITMLK